MSIDNTLATVVGYNEILDDTNNTIITNLNNVEDKLSHFNNLINNFNNKLNNILDSSINTIVSEIDTYKENKVSLDVSMSNILSSAITNRGISENQILENIVFGLDDKIENNKNLLSTNITSIIDSKLNATNTSLNNIMSNNNNAVNNYINTINMENKLDIINYKVNINETEHTNSDSSFVSLLTDLEITNPEDQNNIIQYIGNYVLPIYDYI